MKILAILLSAFSFCVFSPAPALAVTNTTMPRTLVYSFTFDVQQTGDITNDQTGVAAKVSGCARSAKRGRREPIPATSTTPDKSP